MTKHTGQTDSKPSLDKSENADFKSWVNHPKNVARLQILVIVLGIFVVVGAATVIGRIAYLTLYQADAATSPTSAAVAPSPQIAPPPADAAVEQPFEIPPGAVVQDIQPMGNGSVMVRIQDTRGTAIIIFDPTSGAVLRKWRFVPAAN